MLTLRYCQHLLLIAGAAGAAACTAGKERPPAENAGTAQARTASGAAYAYDRIALDTTRQPGTIIDSVFPMQEMLRRFRVGLPPVRSFDGGAPSRTALVDRFVDALAARDAQQLGALTLSRAEFAWIYIPSVADTTDDRGLPPARRWDIMLLSSEKGIARALDRIGGKPLTRQTLDCPNPPATMRGIVVHDGCTVSLTATGGSPVRGRLFGPIIEYRGQFKFLGYSNDM
jgi:hypothetical protein